MDRKSAIGARWSGTYLVGITEPALSKHLRQLADAGVLEPRRDGRYVLYHLRRERIAGLAGSLLAFLDPPEGA